MRSLPFTIFLLVATALVVSLASVRFSEGSLDRLFGSGSIGIGDRLYDFDPMKIHRIRLSGNGVKAECVFEKGIWRVVKPWPDRMDPSIADGILNFTLGTRIEDVIPEGKIDTTKAGFVEGTIGIRVEDVDGNALATYLLGRRTEWIHFDPETKVETPTVFLQPQEGSHSGTIYATTGDIHYLFRDGLRHLRDHHPLFFNPVALQSIRIQNSSGEILLDREGSGVPWRISKPLELRTDRDAVQKLLVDLFNLRATKVADRSEVTLPADEVNGRQRIALKHFGQIDEVVMEIYPPASAGAETVYATASDRPNTVFELRLKPLATPSGPDGVPSSSADELVSLAALPDTVNELRDHLLTGLSVQEIHGVRISPATSSEIALILPEGGRWQVFNPAGTLEPANQSAVDQVLQALTATKVAGFASDAAVDLSPYGLDLPALRVRVATRTGEPLDLSFGQARDGSWHAMRSGVPTVLKLDDTFITQIPTRLWQWRQPHVWSIAAVDLAFIERAIDGRPTLQLGYDWITESWTATEAGENRTGELVIERANRLLAPLLELECRNWISPEDASVRAALERPTLRITLGLKERDSDGEIIGVRRRELLLTPASDNPNNRIYFGRVDREPLPFMLTSEAVSLLTVDLFGDD